MQNSLPRTPSIGCSSHFHFPIQTMPSSPLSTATKNTRTVPTWTASTFDFQEIQPDAETVFRAQSIAICILGCNILNAPDDTLAGKAVMKLSEAPEAKNTRLISCIGEELLQDLKAKTQLTSPLRIIHTHLSRHYLDVFGVLIG